MKISVTFMLILLVLLSVYAGICMTGIKNVTRWFKISMGIIAFIAIETGVSACINGVNPVLSVCMALLVFWGFLLIPIYFRMLKE